MIGLSRVAWLTTGVVVGAYASVKARRAAYRLSAPGIADQVAAARIGWNELRDEIADGMAQHERQQIDHLTRKQLR